GKSLRMEVGFLHKNGNYIQLEAVATNLLNEPAVKSIVVNFSDITGRKAGEDALRESEFELANAERMAKMGNWIVIATNPHAPEKLYWSREMYRIVNRDPGIFIPTLAAQMDLFVPEDARKLAEAVASSMKTGEPYDIELQMKDEEGRNAKWIRSHSELVYDGEGRINGMRGTAQDITERRKSEAELEESREKYKGLSTAAFESIFISEKGICIEQNQSAERMFGYTSEEAIGRYGTEWIAPRDREMVMQHMLEGYEEPYEAMALKKDGTIFPCIMQGKTMHYKGRTVRVTSLSDNTSRKQAEDNLTVSEQRYRKLFNQANEGLILLTMEGKIAELNQSFADMHGYTVDEMKNMHIKELDVLRDGAFDGRAAVMQRLYDGETVRFEVEHYHKNGHSFFLSDTVSIITVAEQQYFLAFHQDITERKQAEEKILELNRDLELRVKLRTSELETAIKELESFSYSVSHDLKAPLRHISGFIGLLLENKSKELTAEELGYLEVISSSASDMGKLIDGILNFSRLNAIELQKKRICSSDLVQEVIKFFEPDIQNRTVTFNVASLPDINGDKELLRQVWINLISNAIKYTMKKPEARIEIGSSSTDTEITFFIKDNGAGFNMKYAEKLFGVFQRLHKARDFEGVGIGLANVNRIVTRHGGLCRAEGEADKGATFYFILPK
ncbi:MAG: PAS domain S-box protein, partial [bacterium]